MFEKLKLTEDRFEEISGKLSSPEIISDNELYAKLMKEYKSLTPIVEKYREYTAAVNDRDGAKELLEESGIDKEMKELARAEFDDAEERIAEISEELKILLIPKDPNDDNKNAEDKTGKPSWISVSSLTRRDAHNQYLDDVRKDLATYPNFAEVYNAVKGKKIRGVEDKVFDFTVFKDGQPTADTIKRPMTTLEYVND